MKRFLFVLAIFLCTASLVFSQLSDARRFVTAQTVAVKETTGFFARDIGSLSLGNEVILLRDNGRWSEIRAGNLTGWVSSSVLSTRRIVPSGSSATVTEVALAGKGFSPDMEIEYRRNGLDYSMVDAMENMRIPQNELLNFINEGRLARGE